MSLKLGIAYQPTLHSYLNLEEWCLREPVSQKFNLSLE